MEAVAQTPAVVGDDNGVETGCRWTHNNPPMPRRRPCPDRLRWRDQQRRSDSAGLCNSHHERQASGTMPPSLAQIAHCDTPGSTLGAVVAGGSTAAGKAAAPFAAGMRTAPHMARPPRAELAHNTAL